MSSVPAPSSSSSPTSVDSGSDQAIAALEDEQNKSFAATIKLNTVSGHGELMNKIAAKDPTQ